MGLEMYIVVDCISYVVQCMVVNILGQDLLTRRCIKVNIEVLFNVHFGVVVCQGKIDVGLSSS